MRFAVSQKVWLQMNVDLGVNTFQLKGYLWLAVFALKQFLIYRYCADEPDSPDLMSIFLNFGLFFSFSKRL